MTYGSQPRLVAANPTSEHHFASQTHSTNSRMLPADPTSSKVDRADHRIRVPASNVGRWLGEKPRQPWGIRILEQKNKLVIRTGAARLASANGDCKTDSQLVLRR
eukprot:3612406-Rhodomonas_salina.2